ncbi:hypothetical protein ACUN8C_07015 [Kushneria sp. Sum13]|uniref:hypothetical protein n=1 Tax=Kushneria sp. Sum13 TaxID=3459196 RepID=UPI0040455351
MASRYEVHEHATAHVKGAPNREQQKEMDDMPLACFRIWDHQQAQYVSEEYEVREEAEEDCQRLNDEV